jgi:sugar/nucleoside kinase (ribokinase family)
MTVTIIGTLAFDSIKSPYGAHSKLLGGTACYAGLSSTKFAKTNLISIIGKDFPQKHIDMFTALDVNIDGIVSSEQDTFHWSGYYEKDMNQAYTIQTDLNCLLEFDPIIPDNLKDSRIVFCANNDPIIQLKSIKQFNSPELIVLDTMNFWIESKIDELRAVIKEVDVLIINDGEARLLTQENNLITAIKNIRELGPKRVIIKKGEHGAIMYNGTDFFVMPALPIETVVDPTGAGDSFTGAFCGYLSNQESFTEEAFKSAIIYGTLVSSQTIQGFGPDTLSNLTMSAIEKLYSEFLEQTVLPKLNVISK